MKISVYSGAKTERELLAHYELDGERLLAAYGDGKTRRLHEESGFSTSTGDKVFPSDGLAFIDALRTYYANSRTVWVEVEPVEERRPLGTRQGVPLLRSLEMSWPYGEYLEGSPEAIASDIIRRLGERFPDEPNNGKALLVPDTPAIPSWQLVGRFTSYAAIAGSEGARLELCWFEDDLAVPIPLMVQRALQRVSWNERAEPIYDLLF